MNPRTVRAIHLAASVALLACVPFDLPRAASAQQTSSATIVGRWRSLETSKGGIGTILEFRSDGTLDFSPGAVVPMPWRIENAQLILPSATTNGPEQKYTLKWLGRNTLRWESPQGSTELARVGDPPDPANPILGEWIENREMNGRPMVARYLFYPRGELLLLIPFATQRGSYAISGSTLHLQTPRRDSESRFTLAGDRLTLSDLQTGRESHYARY